MIKEGSKLHTACANLVKGAAFRGQYGGPAKWVAFLLESEKGDAGDAPFCESPQ